MTPEFVRLDAQYVEYQRESSRWQTDGTHEEGDGLLLLAGTLPFPAAVNTMFRLDSSLPAGAALARARSFFAAKGRGFSVHIRGEQDDDLAAEAAAEGFYAVGDPSPWMVLRSAPKAEPAISGIRVEEVTDARGLEGVRVVSREAWLPAGLPVDVTNSLFESDARLLASHIRFVVAWEGDEPRATAMCHLHEGVAGIHWVGTRNAARRRGLGSVCTQAVTAWGFERGADCAVLQASVQGFPIYQRMGFESFSFTRFFITGPPEDAGR